MGRSKKNLCKFPKANLLDVDLSTNCPTHLHNLLFVIYTSTVRTNFLILIKTLYINRCNKDRMFSPVNFWKKQWFLLLKYMYCEVVDNPPPPPSHLEDLLELKQS